MIDTAFKRGLRDGIPICLGYLSVSFTYGLHAVENGMPFWMALLISMTNLTSAGQFAGTDLILAGGKYLEVAVTTFIINIRYMLMSLSLSQKTNMTTSQRLLLSFGVTDEIYAVAIQEKTVTAAYLSGLILLPYLGWTFGTLLGSTATGLLPIAIRSALGIAIYGMFLAIIIPPSTKVRAVAITILLAAGLSCSFRYMPLLNKLSGGWAIIICTVIASAIAALRYPVTPEETS